MFFILSKVLLFLLSPFWWIILLFVWMMFTRSEKRRKKLRIAIIIIAIVFTNPFIFRTVALYWQPEPVDIAADKKYDAGILLGGMAGYDKYDKGYFGPAADRFIQTANLYHRGIINKIIITGGTGRLMQNEPAESFFLKDELIKNGVPDSSIIIESESRNTYENAMYSKKLIDSLHLLPPFVLITSAMHMPRSMHVFHKAGYSFIPYPCNYTVLASRFSFETHIAPDAEILEGWEDLIKEMVGLLVYKLTGKA